MIFNFSLLIKFVVYTLIKLRAKKKNGENDRVLRGVLISLIDNTHTHELTSDNYRASSKNKPLSRRCWREQLNHKRVTNATWRAKSLLVYVGGALNAENELPETCGCCCLIY